MIQRTGQLARLTTLSLLSTLLVMELSPHALGAQAQSSPGAMLMATDTVNPGISLILRKGPVGSRAAVSGRGFVPHGTITVTFDGSSVATSCPADATGSFSFCAFTVPVAAAGPHAVTASDSTTNSASVTFTNAAAASDTNSGTATNPLASDFRLPGIGLNPDSGVVGSREPVGGAGFAPHSPITLTFDGTKVNDPRTCVTDAIGRFDCAFTVPPAITGHHTVAASDTRFINSAAAIYSVNTAINLQDPAGAADSRDVVIGSGFAPHSPIAFGFDDDSAQGPPCTSDAKGGFRCPFIVPETVAGAHTLTALDNTFTNGVSATFTVNPSISVSATSGTVGSSHAVSGQGFAPNSPIALTFDGSPVATSCAADANGSFDSCTFIVPAVPAGSYIVTASDSSANSASAIFGITPAIGLTPSAGPAGSRAAVSGRGFAPGPITVRFDGSSVGTDCTANATGSFDYCAFTVPDASAGSHTVRASGSSAKSAAASYTVDPAISLNPSAGAAGSTVLLSGGNYTPNSRLTVTFDGSWRPTSGTCTTDASGYLPTGNNCAFIVPAKTAGSYTVTVSDGTYSGSATFTVNAGLSLIPSAGPGTVAPISLIPSTGAGTVIRVISLIPSAGTGGSGAAVSGSGFTPYSTIALRFDGSSVATFCTADATGSISYCAFTVPAVAAGIHTVTASDGTVYSAAASYTVTPAISLNRIVGAAGSTVLLSSSSYTPNSSLTVTFNGAARRTSGICITDASGYLLASNNCTFTVPAVPAGSYTVTASDGTYSGSATFTVIRGISLLPSVGPMGSSVAVSGSGFTPHSRITTLAFGSSSVPVTGPGGIGIPCTVDASGRFSACAFIVPPVAAGSYTVTATDTSANSASATYTVKPVINLLSSAGIVGSTAAVSGSGFAPFAPITMSFNGSSVPTSCTANGSGAFSACTFKVPAAPAGPGTVTVSDGTDAGTTTSTFTVKPAISSTGGVGGSTAVSGTGFARKDKITLAVDGSSVPTSCTTDATGSFNACALPATTAGIHNVAATDTKANSASATFTV